MTPKNLILIGLLAILATASGYVFTRSMDVESSASSAKESAAPIRLSRDKVNRNLFPNQLRWALKELGDRLERPGNERRTMVAELQQTTGSASVQLVQEFPDRLRLLVENGSPARVVTFDGNEARGLGRPPDLRERDLIESLVYDSAEHFFINQTRGQTARALGSRFRSDDGRYYDIYELTDAVNVGAVRRAQTKHYYLNSDTQLLEKVRYVIERHGATIQVETRFEDWQISDRQRFPSRISRIENGNPVWTISASSVAISPMSDDGIFSRP